MQWTPNTQMHTHSNGWASTSAGLAYFCAWPNHDFHHNSASAFSRHAPILWVVVSIFASFSGGLKNCREVGWTRITIREQRQSCLCQLEGVSTPLFVEHSTLPILIACLNWWAFKWSCSACVCSFNQPLVLTTEFRTTVVGSGVKDAWIACVNSVKEKCVGNHCCKMCLQCIIQKLLHQQWCWPEIVSAFRCFSCLKHRKITDQYPHGCAQLVGTLLQYKEHSWWCVQQDLHSIRHLFKNAQLHKQSCECECVFVLVVSASVVHLNIQNWWQMIL